jgi:hypothetical protein
MAKYDFFTEVDGKNYANFGLRLSDNDYHFGSVTFCYNLIVYMAGRLDRIYLSADAVPVSQG